MVGGGDDDDEYMSAGRTCMDMSNVDSSSNEALDTVEEKDDIHATKDDLTTIGGQYIYQDRPSIEDLARKRSEFGDVAGEIVEPKILTVEDILKESTDVKVVVREACIVESEGGSDVGTIEELTSEMEEFQVRNVMQFSFSKYFHISLAFSTPIPLPSNA